MYTAKNPCFATEASCRLTCTAIRFRFRRCRQHCYRDTVEQRAHRFEAVSAFNCVLTVSTMPHRSAMYSSMTCTRRARVRASGVPFTRNLCHVSDCEAPCSPAGRVRQIPMQLQHRQDWRKLRHVLGKPCQWRSSAEALTAQALRILRTTLSSTELRGSCMYDPRGTYGSDVCPTMSSVSAYGLAAVLLPRRPARLGGVLSSSEFFAAEWDILTPSNERPRASYGAFSRPVSHVFSWRSRPLRHLIMYYVKEDPISYATPRAAGGSREVRLRAAFVPAHTNLRPRRTAAHARICQR